MATLSWINIGSGNDLLPDGTTHYLNQHWLKIIAIYSSVISLKIHRIYWQKVSFEIFFFLDFLMYLPGDNELIHTHKTRDTNEI